MAYGPRLELRARLSRNNAQDWALDNQIYEELVDRICELITDQRYVDIHPRIVETGIDWERP